MTAVRRKRVAGVGVCTYGVDTEASGPKQEIKNPLYFRESTGTHMSHKRERWYWKSKMGFPIDQSQLY